MVGCGALNAEMWVRYLLEEPLLYEHPGIYTVGTRLLMITERRKDTGTKTRKRVEVRATRYHNEFEEAIQSMYASLEPGQRLYASVNHRDHSHAEYLMAAEINRLAFKGSVDERHEFWFNVQRRWESALRKSPAAKEFLWDFDGALSEYRYELLKADPSISINHWYRTKTDNGIHVLTKPFNYTKVYGELAEKTLHRDGMILWGFCD